jgi:hypothetical protein
MAPSLGRAHERVEVEGGAFERKRGVERLQAAQLPEARVNHLPVLEEEGAGASPVLDLKAARLTLHAQPPDEVGEGLFVEVAGQDHELCALYVFHAKLPNSKRSAGQAQAIYTTGPIYGSANLAPAPFDGAAFLDNAPRVKYNPCHRQPGDTLPLEL